MTIEIGSLDLVLRVSGHQRVGLNCALSNHAKNEGTLTALTDQILRANVYCVDDLYVSFR